MNINKAIANIGFKEYYIPHLNIDNDFQNIAREDCTISLDIQNAVTDVNNIKINESTGRLEAQLILDLTVNAVSNNDNTKHCQINIVLSGLFDYSGSDKNDFYYMLLINGNSTLYSIARTHIITVTALSSTAGQIVIPMVNFVKLLEEAKKEEIKNHPAE